jgi:hypothetical protein
MLILFRLSINDANVSCRDVKKITVALDQKPGADHCISEIRMGRRNMVQTAVRLKRIFTGKTG